MRGKSPEVLTAMQWLVEQVTGVTFWFVPTIDHKFLEKSPAELLKGGRFQRKDIMLGTNSHEGSNFIILSFPQHFGFTRDYNADVTSEQYREMVEQLGLVDSSSDVVIDTISSIYSLPCGSQGNTGDVDGLTYFMALSGMFGDVWFKCPMLKMARPNAREVIM